MSRYTKAEQEEAKKTLRETLPAGSVCRLILSKVSRSGMSRSIRVLNSEDYDYSFLVAKACNLTKDQKAGGVKIGGCGMDMGMELVDCLSYALYGKPIDQRQDYQLEKAGSGGLRMKWL